MVTLRQKRPEILILVLIADCCLCPDSRSEEADGGTSGSDRAEPLGGDPSGGLQARP